MPIRSEKGPDGSAKHYTWDILDKALYYGPQKGWGGAMDRAKARARGMRNNYHGTGAEVSIQTLGVHAKTAAFEVVCVVVDDCYFLGCGYHLVERGRAMENMRIDLCSV